MLLVPFALLLAPASQEPQPLCHPGDHAPAGVLDVRCPLDASWMFSLTTTYTRFKGLRVDAQRIDTGEALALGYQQVPESMDTSTTLLGLMFAAGESVTLHASVPWIENSMKMRTNLGESFTMDSSGLGDVAAGADVVVWQLDEQRVSCGVSVSAPTGSISETGGMPGAPATKLEYAMQLGSGTWDVSGRVDYRTRNDPYTYGVGLAGTARTGENDEGYALGDRFAGTAWGAQEWSPAWSTSFRLTAARWGDVRGADPDLDPTTSPTHDRALQGGQRVDGALGVNWLPFSGRISGSVVGLEVGMPLAEDLHGPQLSEDWFATLHVGISF